LARFLAIDWEQQQLHVVQASTGRGGMRVEQALSWSFPEPLTPASAESLGKKLRDALKEANVAAAPVLACVGRERVILKELRYPAVPAHEEPAVVRFQAAKELTESPDDVIIDYTPMGNGDSDGGERHALAVIVRKEVVASLQGLCRGLGMKLLAVTPRPSAVIGALDRSRKGKVPVGAVEALLVIGPRWADLGILRGQTLLFARSLGALGNLAGEVKRSLTVFNAGSETAVQALFVASDGEEYALCGRLQELLGVPVRFLDSFLPEDTVQVDKARRGRFTAAIGLLQRWSDSPVLGINFVSPKEPRPVRNVGARQKVLAAVVGAFVIVFLFVVGNFVLADRKNQKENLEGELKAREAQFSTMAQESLDINALRDWDSTTVSWIDELYDLTARFPAHKGFRLNNMTAIPKKNAKDKWAASVTLTGVAPAADNTLVHQLVEEINKTGTLRATVEYSKSGTSAQEFQVKVDLMRQPPEKYVTVLKVAPKPPGSAPAATEDEPDVDPEGGKP
jgi:Tfp pilus assembly PilM family ATPase